MEHGPLDLWVGLLLMLFGMFGYYIKKMWEAEQSGAHPSITYLLEKPWGAIAMIFSALCALLFAYWMGQLNEMAAVLIGGGSTSVTDAFRVRAENKVINQ